MTSKRTFEEYLEVLYRDTDISIYLSIYLYIYMCMCVCTCTEDTRALVSQSPKFRDRVEMILWIHTYTVHRRILGMDRDRSRGLKYSCRRVSVP